MYEIDQLFNGRDIYDLPVSGIHSSSGAVNQLLSQYNQFYTNPSSNTLMNNFYDTLGYGSSDRVFLGWNTKTGDQFTEHIYTCREYDTDPIYSKFDCPTCLTGMLEYSDYLKLNKFYRNDGVSSGYSADSCDTNVKFMCVCLG